MQEWDLRKDYEPIESYIRPPWDDTTQESVVEDKEKPKEEAVTPFGPYDDVFAYPVTKSSVDRAKKFVNTMEAVGGTNINDALLRALNNTQSVQSRLRLTPIIIFLTDGEATVGTVSTDAILSNVRRANSDGIVSIFTLAFGTGTDFPFLTKVSLQNGGFARKIYEASDATLQLKGFFDEVASPLLKSVRFEYHGAELKNVTDTKATSYFAGSELVVTGRLADSSSLDVVVNATGADGPFGFIIRDRHVPKPLNVTTRSSNGFSLEKIWAYLTIQQLLKKSQADDKEAETFKQKALNLSLAVRNQHIMF